MMDRTERIIDNLEKDFCLSLDELKKIINDFHSEMDKGLKGARSSLKMLPTYVDKPTGNEKGRFIALDLGGTNFRILEIELKGAGQVKKLGEKKFVLDEKIISSTAKEMFGFISQCIKEFICEKRGQANPFSLTGWTFSFPVKQTAVDSGILLHWTKGFSVKAAVGKDVVKLLNYALIKKGISQVRINALINDTVGTFLYRSYNDPDCDMAVILGTGTNSCYRDDSKKMLINIEWGNFNKLKTTVYDRLLDKNSENKGSQILEKMVSGMYLPEITRLIMLELGYSAFTAKTGFRTEHMLIIENDNTRKLSTVQGLLRQLGEGSGCFPTSHPEEPRHRFVRRGDEGSLSGLNDRRLLKRICSLVSCRSAFIVSAGIASVLTKIDPGLSRRHTVAVDGSVYEKYTGFSEKIKRGLKIIFGSAAKKIRLSLTKDGSGIGAAIAAALAGMIFCFIISNCVYAAPCYGTKMPDRNKFFLGAENYTIFKRYLEDNYGKVRSKQNFLLLSYGVFDWMSVDLKAGAGNIKQHPVGSDEIDYPSDFDGGYGFRLKFYNTEKVDLVCGFQHISVHPKSVHIGQTRNKAILDDWQFSVLCSYTAGRITPYLGSQWSRVDYIHWVEGERKRRMSDLTKGIGLVCGMDLALTERIWVNLETQFFDSEALAFSLNYGF